MYRKVFKKLIAVGVSISMALLTGCSSNRGKNECQIVIEDYEKVIYDSVDAVKGDIQPILSLKLKSENFEKKNYFPLYDEMEVESVNVEIGDSVKKGDILISFKSGDIEAQLEQYQEQIDNDNMLLEHYKKLASIEKSDAYNENIDNLSKDLEVANLYVKELNAKLDSYSIKAEGDGTVYLLSDLASYGIVNKNNNLITIIYGNEKFTTETSDDYNFKVGDTYTASYGVANYPMVLTDIEETGTNSDGSKQKKLTFTLSEDSSACNSDTLSMEIQKPKLTNVLYVPKDCVFDVEEKQYVYLLDDDGFRRAVEVKIGSTIDGNTVIESGITEGDKVVIQG